MTVEVPKKPRKDFWDIVAVVFHPLGGLLTAISVAFVGMRGSQVLERRQSIDTNARLYSELMSRREEAETSLRKDMLTSIISSFLAPASQNDVDAKVLNLSSGEYQMVILDEILGSIKAGLVSLEQVIDFVAAKPPDLHLVLTGRNAPPELIDVADLVSEIIPIKHPYQDGIMAQRGIEF